MKFKKNNVKIEITETKDDKICIDITTSTITTTSSTEQSVTATPKKTQKTITIKITTQPTTLGYSEMIKKYGNYRFQFSQNCSQITPNSMVMKSGAQFMIDNREDKNHTFVFSQQKYYVKPYGSVVVTTKETGKQTLYCDGIQRAIVEVAK